MAECHPVSRRNSELKPKSEAGANHAGECRGESSRRIIPANAGANHPGECTGESCRRMHGRIMPANARANHAGECKGESCRRMHGRIIPANARANHAGECKGEFIRRYSPYARGNANVTCAPRPSPALCSVNVPPWDSTIARAIVKPTPAPPVARVRDGSTR